MWKSLVLVILAVSPSFAWRAYNNPDRYPSIGFELSKGRLAGIEKQAPAGHSGTDGGYVMFHTDYRLPVRDSLTLTFTGESTTVNNNLNYTEGYRLGVGMRFYVR